MKTTLPEQFVDKATAHRPKAVVETIVKLSIELCFVALPLIVLAFVLGGKNLNEELWHSSEWSFASCVLFGQALVKLVLGCMKSGNGANHIGVIFSMTIVLVFGIIPSLVFLVQILELEFGVKHSHSKEGLTHAWFTLQFVWFCLSIVTFYFVGGIGEYKTLSSESRDY